MIQPDGLLFMVSFSLFFALPFAYLSNRFVTRSLRNLVSEGASSNPCRNAIVSNNDIRPSGTDGNGLWCVFIQFSSIMISF
jgi:hypothetical protein